MLALRAWHGVPARCLHTRAGARGIICGVGVARLRAGAGGAVRARRLSSHARSLRFACCGASARIYHLDVWRRRAGAGGASSSPQHHLTHAAFTTRPPSHPLSRINLTHTHWRKTVRAAAAHVVLRAWRARARARAWRCLVCWRAWLRKTKRGVARAFVDHRKRFLLHARSHDLLSHFMHGIFAFSLRAYLCAGLWHGM